MVFSLLNVVNGEPCIGVLLMFPVQLGVSFWVLSTDELLPDDSSSLVGMDEWMGVDGDWLLDVKLLLSIQDMANPKIFVGYILFFEMAIFSYWG